MIIVLNDFWPTDSMVTEGEEQRETFRIFFQSQQEPTVMRFHVLCMAATLSSRFFCDSFDYSN